jgi:hypothetical protein
MSVYLANLLTEMGIPIARNAFLQAQAPPYIVYVFSHSTNYLADSKVYLKRGNYQIELYTEKKDPALEAKLEGLFDAHGLVYDKTESYLDSEKLLEVIYEIQLIGG